MAVSRNRKFSALCVLTFGFVLSVYGLYVDLRKESDVSYTALCDVSQTVSCTKLLTSKYSKGFGIIGPVFGNDHWLNQHNAVYGVFGYAFLAFIQISNLQLARRISLIAAIGLNLMSVYLATILIELRIICLVCMTTYIVNFLYLYLSIKQASKEEKRKKI